MKVAVFVLSLVLLQKDPTASDAWAAAADGSFFVYATITNPAMYDVYLVSAKSDAAEKAELWEKEKPAASLTVPAYGSIELKPSEARVRLSGLKRQVKTGEVVKVTLVSDGGIEISLAATVK